MQHCTISIRPFIGAKNFDLSRGFYRDMGFTESILFPAMSLFTYGSTSFYLQNAYVKDWVDNTQVFMEVKELPQFWDELVKLNLPEKYSGVRITPIHYDTWGNECFVYDPSGVLWHFGEFRKKQEVG